METSNLHYKSTRIGRLALLHCDPGLNNVVVLLVDLATLYFGLIVKLKFNPMNQIASLDRILPEDVYWKRDRQTDRQRRKKELEL